MSRALVFFLSLVSLGASSSVASAQTAVVFPVGGDAALASANGAEAIARVESDLGESGFTLVSGAALASAMRAAHADECADPSCAGPMLRALGADLAVGVALWPRHGLVQVSVVLVDPQGVQVSADADGAATVIGQLTQAALSQARARWATRSGSPVRVVGTPDGATVTVDREPWGTLPHEGSLAPGTHHFVVSADGHVTERRDVEIPAATEALEIAFALAPGSDAPVTAPATPCAGPDVGLIVAGAVTAAAGAGLLVAGIVIASGTEQCVRGCTGPVMDRVVSVPATELGVGLAVGGAVALAAGVVLAIVGGTTGGSSAGSAALGADGLLVRF